MQGRHAYTLYEGCVYNAGSELGLPGDRIDDGLCDGRQRGFTSTAGPGSKQNGIRFHFLPEYQRCFGVRKAIRYTPLPTGRYRLQFPVTFLSLRERGLFRSHLRSNGEEDTYFSSPIDRSLHSLYGYLLFFHVKSTQQRPEGRQLGFGSWDQAGQKNLKSQMNANISPRPGYHVLGSPGQGNPGNSDPEQDSEPHSSAAGE